MSVACCPLSSGDDYPARVRHITQPVAAKDHKCCECDETIARGAKHELYKAMWDGSWSSFRTCLSCVEIRDHFACDGWVFEHVWEDLETYFFPDMRAGGPCMEGLSPAAKDRLFTRRMAWLENR